jgi:hypothetical protein
MLQRNGIADTPGLDFDAWRSLLRSNCGGELRVTAPNAFAGWLRPSSVCGLAAAAVKIQWGTVVARLSGLSGHLTMFAVMARTIISFYSRWPGSRPCPRSIGPRSLRSAT